MNSDMTGNKWMEIDVAGITQVRLTLTFTCLLSSNLLYKTLIVFI